MVELDQRLSESEIGLTKKEILQLTRRRDKLSRALGGIREMAGLPSIIVVIDTNKEGIAIQEAKKLNIPLVAVVDTNCDPTEITHPVPGNDDATRAINLYCDLFARAVLDGLQAEMVASGQDIGEAEEVVEEVPAETPAEEPASPPAG
jgi:small subunit ribosomal protein S2